MQKRSRSEEQASSEVLTIGHSTRTIEEFIQLLQAHGVTRIADIRTVPRSRRNPQFNQESLPESLKKVGIGYSHFPKLGGLRRAKVDSMNLGWRNTSFRGFADYMQTLPFEEGLSDLISMAKEDRIALMCAEAVPWRCHRSLVSDALLTRGIQVEHIMSATRRQPHAMTPFAEVNGTQIIYPGPAESPQLNLLSREPIETENVGKVRVPDAERDRRRVRR
jgi:uncharacterized protein (DUF488 family)